MFYFTCDRSFTHFVHLSVQSELLGPGNGSPMAKNIVVVVDIRFSKYYNFSFSQPIVVKLRAQIDHNILSNRAVSDFKLKF